MCCFTFYIYHLFLLEHSYYFISQCQKVWMRIFSGWNIFYHILFIFFSSKIHGYHGIFFDAIFSNKNKHILPSKINNIILYDIYILRPVYMYIYLIKYNKGYILVYGFYYLGLYITIYMCLGTTLLTLHYIEINA